MFVFQCLARLLSTPIREKSYRRSLFRSVPSYRRRISLTFHKNKLCKCRSLVNSKKGPFVNTKVSCDGEEISQPEGLDTPNMQGVIDRIFKEVGRYSGNFNKIYLY